ncbi:hypothetical protein [Tolumonas lignilytica]|uniref:8-oxoguanine DNA glycosylase OGG fold protein n=1 Tax=Tolumonas lignilytica TaxID=1283284 RepID=UPI000464098D|nr:hypothetical protein [Tolumonas lignilytica]
MFKIPELPSQLQMNQDKIQKIVPENQSFMYEISRWGEPSLNMSSRDECKKILAKFSGKISRGDVISMAQNFFKKQTDEILASELFFSVMLWGWSDQPIGVPRTDNIYLSNSSEHIAKSIIQAAKHIQIGDIISAYSTWDVKYCKMAFMTKMFYFLGVASEQKPLPLILDANVVSKLDRLGLDATNFASWTLDNKSNKYGVTADTKQSPSKYNNYVNMMNVWADQLSCRPDQLEMFIFTTNF